MESVSIPDCFQLITQLYSELSPFQAFVAGYACHKTNLNPNLILRIILRIHKAHAMRLISLQQNMELLNILGQGNVSEVSAQLKRYENSVTSQLREAEYKLQQDMLALLQEEEQFDKMQRLAEEERQSQELIKQLMEEENKRAIAPPITLCYLCNRQVLENIITVNNCPHTFHRQCISGLLTEIIQNNEHQIRSPCCNNTINEDLLSNLLPQETILKYHQNQMNKMNMSGMANQTKCPNPTCMAMFNFNSSIQFYYCLVCQGNYCLICGENAHPNLTCDQLAQQPVPYVNQDQNFVICSRCGTYNKQNPRFNVVNCVCGVRLCKLCGRPIGDCSCNHARRQSQIQFRNGAVQILQSVKFVFLSLRQDFL